MKKTQQSWIFPRLYIGILQHSHVEDYKGVLFYFAHIMLDFFLKIVENVYTEHWIT